LDEQVVRQDKDLEKLEQQFVCVRLVQMKAVDLRLFQFDYDQTWAVFFLNADGTIYGRYGTRAGNQNHSTTHISVASFKKAMERALELHKGYPANKDQLAGKRGPEPEYAVADKIPGLDKGHCIHCHQVRENVLRLKWQQKKLTAADIWPYPLPENVGLRLDVDDGLKVKAVTKDSPAAKAGIEPGDELVKLNRQSLLSPADIQWVLHQAPAQTKLTATVQRGKEMLEKMLVLSGNWKETDLGWRASSWFGLRHGLQTAPLSNDEKRKRDIPADGLALVVKNLHANAKPLSHAGLRPGDVIVGVDGKVEAMGEMQFVVYLRLNHPPGDKVKLTVLRGKERQELTVPMW
jgi:hypothetical protein